MKALDKHTYGPTSASFQRVVLETLQEEVKPMRRKIVPLVIAFALMLTLLAGVALAVAITAQEQKVAVRIALEAVAEKYGYTGDTLNHFRTEVTAEKDEKGVQVWRVKILPNLYFDKLGDYTVDVPQGTEAASSVSWTHDGTDMEAVASGEWTNPAWGPRQLERLNEFNDIYSGLVEAMEAELGPRSVWSLADKAELSKFWIDSGHPKPDAFIWLVPEEGEMTEEEAMAHAYALIDEKYGATAEELAEYEYQVDYLTATNWEEGLKQWEFYFYPEGLDPDYDESKGYRVRFNIPTMEVELCLWYTDDFWAAAPELLENGKLDAIYEKIGTIARNELTPAEKAMYTAPLREAGYDLSMMEGHYIAPGEGDLPQQKAVTTARGAMQAEGFTWRTLNQFSVHPALILSDKGERLWSITYETYYGGRMRVPSYVVLVWQDGTIESVKAYTGSWRDRKEITEMPKKEEAGLPLLQKTLWTPADVEAFYTLENEAKKILRENQDADGQTTMEGLALHDRLYREAGSEGYRHDLPGKNDISLEKAVEIARKTIAERYDIPLETLEGYKALAEFYLTETDHPEWQLHLVPVRDSDQPSFMVMINSVTGAINDEYKLSPNG